MVASKAWLKVLGMACWMESSMVHVKASWKAFGQVSEKEYETASSMDSLMAF